MSKQFRDCNLNQLLLLPVSLQDWLPEGHLARFVAEVVETLDLSATYSTYEEGDGRGLAAYDPRMMVRVLLYGYCRGVASSRRIERATYEDVAFRYLAADAHPDPDTIAGSRKGHMAALAQRAAEDSRSDINLLLEEIKSLRRTTAVLNITSEVIESGRKVEPAAQKTQSLMRYL
jgi:transposase